MYALSDFKVNIEEMGDFIKVELRHIAQAPPIIPVTDLEQLILQLLIDLPTSSSSNLARRLSMRRDTVTFEGEGAIDARRINPNRPMVCNGCRKSLPFRAVKGWTFPMGGFGTYPPTNFLLGKGIGLKLISSFKTYHSIFKFLGNLFKSKAEKNFDHRNTWRISRIKIFFQRRSWEN